MTKHTLKFIFGFFLNNIKNIKAMKIGKNIKNDITII